MRNYRVAERERLAVHEPGNVENLQNIDEKTEKIFGK
jgi:hypothetical protein